MRCSLCVLPPLPALRMGRLGGISILLFSWEEFVIFGAVYGGVGVAVWRELGPLVERQQGEHRSEQL